MKDTDLARQSLAAVWLGTALASLHDGGQAAAATLAGVSGGGAAALALVWLASAWDALLGGALLLRPGARTYRLAFVSVVVLTAAATWMRPALWLDPFGPLLKNLPLLVLLWQCQRTCREEIAS